GGVGRGEVERLSHRVERVRHQLVGRIRREELLEPAPGGGEAAAVELLAGPLVHLVGGGARRRRGRGRGHRRGRGGAGRIGRGGRGPGRIAAGGLDPHGADFVLEELDLALGGAGGEQEEGGQDAKTQRRKDAGSRRRPHFASLRPCVFPPHFGATSLSPPAR